MKCILQLFSLYVHELQGERPETKTPFFNDPKIDATCPGEWCGSLQEVRIKQRPVHSTASFLAAIVYSMRRYD